MSEAELNLEIRSLVKDTGQLELSLQEISMPAPGENEVLVQMQAAPLNPSDVGLLLGPSDVDSVKGSGTADRPIATLQVPPNALRTLTSRLGKSMPVGNEGAGVVVSAGKSEHSQALIGRTVALMGGGMYCRYRKVKSADCLPLPAGAKASDGADCFVGPMTALGMVATMRAHGLNALIHTAAASGVGQMLAKLCLKDGISLVNIVRSTQQADLLRAIGTEHICDSSVDSFLEDLLQVVTKTRALMAFDAVGGGALAGQILSAMDKAASATNTEYTRYGSPDKKQVYIYGSLDRGSTVIDRSFGLSWSVGGWLVTNYLDTESAEILAQHKLRIAAELTTTFASRYKGTLSLAEALAPENVVAYAKHATGEKMLIDPSL